ncbi:hypothetical protein N0V90_003006 [Kalmusia sp. IMI 367209]|nr:hypothetical protein N0V90_003006 [Kalmusia sp. IMI 367209]
MASSHSIIASTEADIPVLAAFLQSSKLNLAINRFLFKDWPNDAAQKAQYTSAIEGSFKNTAATSLKVIDDTTGDIIAYLFLTRRKPNEPPKTQNDAANQVQPDAMNKEVASTVHKAVEEINRQWTNVDYLELTHIFVRPESRKKGIGAELIRRAIKEARAASVPLVTCAEPPAFKFFQKQGFKSGNHVDIDLRQWAPENCGWGIFRITGISLE